MAVRRMTLAGAIVFFVLPIVSLMAFLFKAYVISCVGFLLWFGMVLILWGLAHPSSLDNPDLWMEESTALNQKRLQLIYQMMGMDQDTEAYKRLNAEYHWFGVKEAECSIKHYEYELLHDLIPQYEYDHGMKQALRNLSQERIFLKEAEARLQK